MDDLRTTLLTLPPDDRRDFAHFIQRQRRKASGRLDSRLFELLVQPKELSTEKLIAKLYPDEPNPVAYYALRKRLLRHLMDYLLLRQRQHDMTAAAAVRGQVTLAQYLFDVGIPRLAWATLRKAEKLAITGEQHEPLNAVYNLQIQHADSPHAPPLAEIISRRHANKKAADEEERANIADSLLRLRLREARTQGRATVSVDAMVQEILAEYDLKDAFTRSPALLCRLLSIVRNAMLLRRDFTTFAPYIERSYKLLERRHGFAPAQRGYQLKLLYMLAHTLYRARRFADSVTYLEQGRALLAALPGQQFTEFEPRFTFLLAANYAFLRRNKEGIVLIEKTLKRASTLNQRDDLTARFQLSFHHFVEGQFAKANQALLSLGRTDHWLEQHLGLEWLINRNLGELIIQHELGHSDLALTRLKAIERGIRERFPATEEAPEGGPYQPVLRYLHLVHEIISEPDLVQQVDFATRVSQIPNFLTTQQEDLQVLSFYAWLRARVKGRPYYEVLLELAEQQ
ncbi:hypothetical protein Q5H93_10550 [Hymenobacter sp. ASUV-10]|uniref:Tetratricopeptide repeat protein n=1 Tax=Hymenobacter aranciens TaxID=3063996 RepID=A0ABT9BDR7_9BACT|nr:hypothetical protein [Hymenobacter sp. ASUV-10]MDO7875172.1 hypothetical protein [Hymenobacter sp. ASUV-10]